MPKMLADGNTKLVWVEALANFHAPTVAELNAGLDLSCLVTAADYQLGDATDGEINDPPLCSNQDVMAPGRTTYAGQMNFFRWTTVPEDTAWTTFTQKGIAGYLIQRVGKASGDPWAAGDEVQVYQVITGTPAMLSPGQNAYHKFRQRFFVQESVDERAEVAA